MKKAFTLAEILIALTIVGVLATLMLQNVKSDKFQEKANIAKAYKAINTFDEASANIRDVGSTNCPMGTFIYKAGKNNDGTYDYALGLVLPASNKERAVFNMYSEYIKFEKTGLNFCKYSKYCEKQNVGAAEEDKITNITAVKFSGDIYAGLKLLDTISDCPSFNMPENEGKLTPRSKIKGGVPKCWAKLYIDTNGLEGPNEEGKDIFVFGLDELGVFH